MGSAMEHMLAMGVREREKFLRKLPSEVVARMPWDWDLWARDKQKVPPGKWRVWLLNAGRGLGKTRTGAETIRRWAEEARDRGQPEQFGIVGQTVTDVRDTMLYGPAGLMTISPPWWMPRHVASATKIEWPDGTVALTRSGDVPDQLRGPEFHKAWVDELAKFQYPDETWDNLEMGLRAGDSPQAVVTTTPRPIKLMRRLIEESYKPDPKVIVTTGSSYENIANLSPMFIERVIARYEGTRIGRQEIHAELLLDTPGSLWTHEMLERNRVDVTPDDLRRIVVAIDPAVSSGEESDETGIVVAGVAVRQGRGGRPETHGYVISDKSGVFTPDEWARLAIAAYANYEADRIIGEVNNGGDMIQTVLRHTERYVRDREGGVRNVAYRAVRASRGKHVRAEPVAALYEQGRVHHVGVFPAMEDQMCATTTEGYTGTGSPDRMDAAVWALTDLMLGAAIAGSEEFATVRV